jgi:SAM-dependent methyltransferase
VRETHLLAASAVSEPLVDSLRFVGNNAQLHSNIAPAGDLIPVLDVLGRVISVRHARLGYELPIRPNGYSPKSGVLVAKFLDDLDVANKVVFDIGTGETALLAVHSAALGAKHVVGIDVDPIAVAWARRSIHCGPYKEKIEIHLGSIAKFSPAYQADLIVSNPPQMPVPRHISIHDDGGWSGRDVLIEIFNFCDLHLREGGTLLISIMDFLGTAKSFSPRYPALFDVMREHALVPNLLASTPKELVPGGHTHRNMNHIQSVYPQYQFPISIKGNPMIHLEILSAKKSVHNKVDA